MDKILVTGSEGFVGYHIVKELTRNYKVYGIDNLCKHNIKRPSIENYIHINYNILEIQKRPWDINYCNLIKEINPSIIIDMASIVGGVNKINNSNDVVNNINIFNNTFEASKQLKNLKQYIFFSSSIIYDRVNTIPTPELDLKDIPLPNSPYGFYKYSCEFLLKNSSIPHTILRLFNCIGTGDDNEQYAHVFTDFIRQAKRNHQICVKGGNQYRTFISCRDVANIVNNILGIHPYSLGHTYNIGHPNNYISIQEFAHLIAKKIPNTDIVLNSNTNSFDVHNMRPNINKIINQFDFYPIHTLDECLDECVKYYN